MPAPDAPPPATLGSAAAVVAFMKKDKLMQSHFKNFLKENGKASGAFLYSEGKPKNFAELRNFHSNFSAMIPQLYNADMRPYRESEFKKTGVTPTPAEAQSLLKKFEKWAETTTVLAYKIFNKKGNEHYKLYLIDMATLKTNNINWTGLIATITGKNSTDATVMLKAKGPKFLEKIARHACMRDISAAKKEAEAFVKIVNKKSSKKYAAMDIVNATIKVLK